MTLAERDANMRSDMWYDGVEGAVLYPKPADELHGHGRLPRDAGPEDAGTGGSLAFMDEAAGMHGQQLHCACDACLAEREQIRKLGLGQMAGARRGKEDSWADRSWDGPLARFPGASGLDGGSNEGGRS